MSCTLNKEFTRYGNQVTSELYTYIKDKVIPNYPHAVKKLWDDNNPENKLSRISDVNSDIVKEFATDYYYAQMKSDKFAEEFGDWQNRPDTITNNRLFKNGSTMEPAILYDKVLQQHYYRNKELDRVPFPLVESGLSYIYSGVQIRKAVASMASEYFKLNQGKDFTNQSFITKGSLKEFVAKLIDTRAGELYDAGDVESDIDKQQLLYDKGLALDDSQYYIDEWVDRLRQKFTNLGFKLKEGKVEEEVTDDTNEGRTYNTVSTERDTKDAVNANIKAMLSSISDTNEVDEVFLKPLLLTSGEVWKKLMDQLHDKPTLMKNGKFVDSFDTIYTEIEKLSVKLPYFDQLIKMFNSEHFTDNRKSEFTQAFNKTRIDFVVTEINVNKSSTIYKVKSVSDVNGKVRSIKSKWYRTMKTLFNKPLADVKDELTHIKDTLTTISKEVTEFKRNNKNQKLILDTKIVTDVMNTLKLLGVNVADIVFESYIGAHHNVSTSQSNLRLEKLIRDSKFMVNKMLISGTEGINLKKENPFNTQNIFKDLAKEDDLLTKNGVDTTIISGGKKHYVYTNPTYLHNQINSWKLNRDSLLSMYNTNPNKKSSQLLKYLLAIDENTNEESKINISKDRIAKLNISTFNVFQNKKTTITSSDPVDNKDISKIDFIGDNINKTLLFKKGGNSIYNTLIPAGKSTMLGIQTGLSIDTQAEFINGLIKFNDKTIDIFYEYFESEYHRMQRELQLITNDPSKARKFAHYQKLDSDNNPIFYKEDGTLAGNAFKSQLFNGLSFSSDNNITNSMYNETGAAILDSLDSKKSEIKEYITTILSDLTIKTGETLSKQNFFSDNYIDHTIKETYIKEQRNSAENYHIALTADYIVNSLISNIEYSKIFTGEIYNYKNQDDYIKRIPGTYTDGMYMRLTESDPVNYNVAIINNVNMKSSYFKELHDSYGEDVANYYDNMDSTDAQAWITPERWKFLIGKLGMWDDNIRDKVYNKLKGIDNTPLTTTEAKLAAQPLKGVYFSENNGKPIYLKYSQMVLSTSLVNGLKIKNLLDEMYNSKVDEVVTVSGVKVGVGIPNKIHDENGKMLDKPVLGNVVKLNNKEWKLQQNLPVKNTKETLVGSQIQKNALMAFIGLNNPMFELNGVELHADDLRAKLNKTIGELSNRGLTKILDSLGVDENNKITNPKALYTQLVEEAKKRNVDENLIKALQKEILIAGIPQSYKKFMTMFASVVNKATVKIKTNGGSFIQTANFGFDELLEDDKSNIIWLTDDIGKGLKPPLIVDGKTQPGQILIPSSYIKAYLPEGVVFENMSAADIKEMISSEAFKNVIGYRIPNQALASNDALEIVGILPDTVGDTIIGYTEIPTKTGSDFDIDKMFVMLPSLEYNKETDKLEYVKQALDEDGLPLDIELQPIKAIQNMLIEQYKATFLHPEVAKKIMVPIDYPHIKEHIKSLFKKEDSKDLELLSPLKQIDIKYSFLAGSAGIGQSANMLVDHARGLSIDGYFNDYYMGWGNEYNKQTVLDREYSQELSKKDLTYINKRLKALYKKQNRLKDFPVNGFNNKYVIADSISALLNGFVDIEKDDYVTSGNWSTQTTNVGLTMMRAGVNPFIVNAFIGQPIIKQYIDFIINKESKLADNNENIDTAFKKLLINSALEKLETVNNGKKTITPTQLLKLYKKEGPSSLTVARSIYKEVSDAEFEVIKNNLTRIKELTSSLADSESGISIPNMSLEDLESQILDEFDAEVQMSVYSKFREILEASKEVVDNIKLMKIDVNGMGKGLSTRLINENLVNKLTSDREYTGKLMNVKNKMRDPKSGELNIVGHYYKNSNHKINEIMKANPRIFPLADKGAEQTFNVISQLLYGDNVLNQELADKMYDAYYSYMMSDFSVIRNENYKDLFTNLANEVIEYKNSENYIENYLIDSIDFMEEYDMEMSETGEITEFLKYTFLNINNVTKNEDTRNDLYNGWKELMEFNPDLGIKLVQYSYYSSGFITNAQEFFSSIPHEILVRNNINKYITDYNKDMFGVDSEFIDQFFRHNMDDNAIVPKVYKNNMTFASKDKSDKWFTYYNEKKEQQKPYLKQGNKLYKLLGYNTEKNGIYIETGKLGHNTAEGKIYEYGQSESKINNFNHSNVNTIMRNLQKSIVHDIMYFSDPNYNNSYDLDIISGIEDMIFGTNNNTPIKNNLKYNLNNKTEQNNIIIKKVYQKAGIEYAKSIDGIFSMRINNSNKHFGNPFTGSGKTGNGVIKSFNTVAEAVQAYKDWITTDKYDNEFSQVQERKQWILEQIESGKLKGKPIVYYKELGELSHANILDELINTNNENNVDDMLTPCK